VLTRQQLQKAIRSGGFLVEPHQGKYDLLVTAATDPYTQCGFRKLIDLNHLQDFLLPHLPNKYIGQMGLEAEDFFRQAEALKAIGAGSRPASTLPDTETKLKEARWSKSYYEPAREDLLNLLPAEARSILSYGCGWGELESALVRKGMDVTAIPLDAVVGACAEARGVRLHYAAKGMGKNGTPVAAFDVVIVSNMLHLSPDPVALLTSLAAHLKPQGKLLASVPNLSRLPVLKRRLAGDPDYKALGEFAQAGIQVTSSRKLRGWFEKSHLDVQQVVPVITNKRDWMRYFPESLFGEWLGDDFLVLAQKN
jgi:2-polyprenyl-3-methyl-5-hydroxy-6-metoxy-1,4-benzoquinol methylase